MLALRRRFRWVPCLCIELYVPYLCIELYVCMCVYVHETDYVVCTTSHFCYIKKFNIVYIILRIFFSFSSLLSIQGWYMKKIA